MKQLTLYISDYTKGNSKRLGANGAAHPSPLHNKVSQVDCSPIVKGIIEHSHYLCGNVSADIRQNIDGVAEQAEKRMRVRSGNWANVWGMRRVCKINDDLRYWIIKRKTVGKRLRRFMKAIYEWCRENLHEPVKEQHRTLSSKLRGYYQYYGIRGNYKMLEVVFEHTERSWRRWLGRRCSKGYVTVDEFDGYYRKEYPLPKPRIIHNF